jgi:hypothetical protein
MWHSDLLMSKTFLLAGIVSGLTKNVGADVAGCEHGHSACQGKRKKRAACRALHTRDQGRRLNLIQYNMLWSTHWLISRRAVVLSEHTLLRVAV